jgi:hypothetical protein
LTLFHIRSSPTWVSLVISGTRGGLLVVAKTPSVRRGSTS